MRMGDICGLETTGMLTVFADGDGYGFTRHLAVAESVPVQGPPPPVLIVDVSTIGFSKS